MEFQVTVFALRRDLKDGLVCDFPSVVSFCFFLLLFSVQSLLLSALQEGLSFVHHSTLRCVSSIFLGRLLLGSYVEVKALAERSDCKEHFLLNAQSLSNTNSLSGFLDDSNLPPLLSSFSLAAVTSAHSSPELSSSG